VGQEHVNVLTPFVQDPPLIQGDEAQLLFKVWQYWPLYPGTQEHVKELRPLMQVAPLLHGFEAQLLTSKLH